jgi:chromosome segregation ATPase
MKKEFENFSESNDKSQKIQIEKFRNDLYFLKCERDQLKLQLNQLNTIKEKYDSTTEKIQKKYEKSKQKIKELSVQLESLEKTNVELREKYSVDTDQVNTKLT